LCRYLIQDSSGNGYAAQSNISFALGWCDHYIAPLSSPQQSIRSFGGHQTKPVRHLIAGKRVVLIDDSIVRGTTRKRL